jgi:hypothetical protein
MFRSKDFESNEIKSLENYKKKLKYKKGKKLIKATEIIIYISTKKI